MSTFLQLCQKLARESGTAPSGQPVSVVGQTGRLAKLVGWVSDCWVQIQDSRADWRFLRKQFLNALSIGTIAYTNLSWNLTDWGEWIGDRLDGPTEQPISIYDPAIGTSDEGPLYQMDWPQFRALYLVGAQVNQRPANYAIGPDGSFNVGPPPDKAYAIHGEYRRDSQVLTGNTDVPICPARFHDVILWRALRRLNARDEAAFAMSAAGVDELGLMDSLARDQLPRVRARRKAMA